MTALIFLAGFTSGAAAAAIATRFIIRRLIGLHFESGGGHIIFRQGPDPFTDPADWGDQPNLGMPSMAWTTEQSDWQLRQAARALIANVRSRHPGEDLHCEYMRALDAALMHSHTT